MHLARLLTSGLTIAALALGMMAGAVPANAAEGFHAAYFSESSFLSLAAGQTGQFAVGYGNTGDVAWVKGSATQQISLHTRNGDISSFQEGWSSNWVAPNIYANQTNDLVAPGQVGFMIYNVQVPATAPQGPKSFFGIEVANGQTLEDYGYFQVVTVTTAQIQITASSPVSPSVSTTPTISGTGATANTLVTVQEGTTALCTSTASATGTFSCTTTVLTSGSHSLTATATGQGTSAPFTYVVDNALPTLSTIDTAQGLARMNVCYSKAMTVTGSSAITNIANYSLSGITLGTTTGSGQVINSIVASGDGRCALFVFGTTNLQNNNTYTLTVNNVRDAAGNAIAGNSTLSFTATDSGAPTATGITQPGTYEIVVTFSEPMTTGTLIASNFRWDSSSFPTTPVVRETGAFAGRQVRLTFNSAVAQGTHSLDISSVTDLSGLTITPNPTSFTVSIAGDTTRPSLTQAVATRGDFNLGTQGAGYLQTVDLTFSEALRRTLDWGCTGALDNTGSYSVANPDGSSGTTGCSSGSGSPITVVTPPTAVGMLTDDSDARWELRGVRLVLSQLLGSGCSYTLTATGLLDQAGNALNPNPTLITISNVADTSALTLVSATASATTLSVCYSKSMFASVTTNGLGFLANTTASNTGANYTFTVSGSTVSLTWNGNSGNNWNVSPDGRCITFTTGSTLVSGTYSLTVTNVTDPSGLAINPNPSTISVSYSDTSAPTLTAATYISSDSFSVQFSKPMTGGATPANSAGNIQNYSLNNNPYGNICTVGTPGISANGTGMIWTLTCSGTGAYLSNYNPGAPLPGGAGNYTVAVRNAADQNGNVLSPNPQTRAY